MLVEDDVLQARLALEAVERCNFLHRTTLVCDGEETLDFVFRRGIFRRAPRPDLILLDLRIPKLDGLEVLSAIKTDFDLKAIPVVIMTSSEDEQDRVECEKHEVEAYVSKPINLQKFLDLIIKLKRFWHEEMVLPTI
ncbi:MAG: response regulator [Pirellulales bacterium]